MRVLWNCLGGGVESVYIFHSKKKKILINQLTGKFQAFLEKD